jgi:hypothetical protein
LSTLKYLFEGEKELYKGLKIESIGYNFEETYPVLLLNMDISSFTPDQLEISLLDVVKIIAEDHRIYLDDRLSSAMSFKNLIKKFKKI